MFTNFVNISHGAAISVKKTLLRKFFFQNYFKIIMLTCICFLNEKEIICYEKKSGIVQSPSDPGFPADARKTSLVRNQFKDIYQRRRLQMFGFQSILNNTRRRLYAITLRGCMCNV